MITKADVEHVSWLASIHVSPEDLEEYVSHFNSILDYFHQLDELDTEEVPPTYRVVDLYNVFREDESRSCLDQSAVLANAPRKENGFFKSPRIV